MYYKTYLLVVGMPRATLDYIGTDDYNFVTTSQMDLNDSYIVDMAKYLAPNKTKRILNVYNSIQGLFFPVSFGTCIGFLLIL